MVRFSLGLVMSLLPTLERRIWTLLAFSHTLDGFSLRLEKAISCLCHLMHRCLTFLIFSPFHTPILPLLISLGLASALDGTIVIGVCRPSITSFVLFVHQDDLQFFLQLSYFHPFSLGDTKFCA